MVRRLLKGGHECVVFDMSAKAVAELVKERAVGTASLAEFVKTLTKPRAVWLMVPAGVVDKTIAELLAHLEAGDIVIDGGNSYYIDDIRRAKELAPKRIHYVDVGTSGGVWGLERGYCMMVGGEADVVKHLDPIFATLSPGRGEDDAKVREWLGVAAKVPGFVGFAVGRTVFWNPLVAWRAGTASREEAAAQIAGRYREFVDLFEER